MSSPITQEEIRSAEWLLDGLGVEVTDERRRLVVSYRRQMGWLASSEMDANQTAKRVVDEATGSLNNAVVAEYLRCTPEQVRIMRLHKITCPECVNVHHSYPQIKAFHSPLCKSNRKCANCGKEIPDLSCGHEVGLICETCYDN